MTNTQHPNAPALAIRPFRVTIPDTELADLQRRLEQTRFPQPAPGDGWDHGTPVSYLREMVDHWRTSFDWRTQEARMNEFPHFLTEIDGQRIHFLHVRSEIADATPIVLTHTYPGSFVDFLDMIGPLTDPEAHGGRREDAFHVVVPSIPGFGFSTPLVDDGWTMARVARTWDRLMRGLGYSSYGAHGSDAGSMVSRELAMLNPHGFLGAHVLQLFSFPSGDPAEFERMTPEDHAALEFAGWFQTVNGYAHMNASRPQTIAAALSDSPVGQLAYNELFENFGNGTSLVSRDQVLTQVSLYWLTNTSAGAVRYHHAERAVQPRVNHGRIGVAVFADDFKSMRPFAERDNTAIMHWTHHEQGGHFASLEVPEAVRGHPRVLPRLDPDQSRATRLVMDDTGSQWLAGLILFSMEIQLRDYRIRQGQMDAWIAGWKSQVVPLREEAGFRLIGAWVDAQGNRFVWLLGYSGPEGFQAADHSYYASLKRRELRPDPSELIEEGTQTMVDAVL